MLTSLKIDNSRFSFFHVALPPPHQSPRRPVDFILVVTGSIHKLVQPQTLYVPSLGTLADDESLNQPGEGLFQLFPKLGDVAQGMISVVVRRLQGGQIERIDRRTRYGRLRRGWTSMMSMMRAREQGLEKVRVDQGGSRAQGAGEEGEEVGLDLGRKEDVDMRSRCVPDVQIKELRYSHDDQYSLGQVIQEIVLPTRATSMTCFAALPASRPSSCTCCPPNRLSRQTSYPV